VKRRHAQTSPSKRGGSTQDLTAAATVAAGQNWPAPAPANPQRRSIAAPLARVLAAVQPTWEDIMRRFRLLIAFPAAVALAVSVAVSAGPVASAQAAPAKLPVITTFTRNHFPESLAIDRQGNLYASLDYIGQVVKVTPGGQQHLVASFDVGKGFLTGLAFDRSGNLYVADATFEASPTPPGVFRISAGGAVTRVATLPTFSFPNGLAFHNGDLYITDSSLSVIWRLPPGGKAAVWLKSPLLAPKTKFGIGANGLAFRRGSFYASVADFGTIVRVPFRANGQPGAPVVIARADLLKTADGIAFDVKGNLYITVNVNRLVRLAPDGGLTVLAIRKNGLAFPDMPAFGTTPATRTTLYFTNGGFHRGPPDIVAFDADVRGLPLP
jgi:sugar lactone lactonase YvrE